MGRKTIMKHIHPSIEQYVNDYTRLDPEYTASSDILISLAIYPTPKGPDNQLIRFNPGEASRMERMFGFGKFKDYGQTMYNCTSLLNNGGTVYFISPKPSNATYANIIVSAKLKEITAQKTDSEGKPLFISDDGSTQTEDNGKPLNSRSLCIKYVTTTIKELTNGTQFESLLEGGYDSEVDSDGFITIPLYGVRSWGRGKYGNNIAVNMVASDAESIKYEFQPYAMTVKEYDSSMRIEDTFSAALNADAINMYNNSEFLEVNVNSNPDTSSELVRAQVSEFGVELLTDKIKEYLTEAELKNVDNDLKVDILFIKDLVSRKEYENVEIDSESADITVDIKLVGGSDGDIDTIKIPKETRNANIIKLLKSAWDGSIDESIYNTTQFKYDIIFDANYPKEIKEAIQSYKLKRDNDGFFIRDIGVHSTVSSALTYRKETIGTIDDYTTSLVMFSGVTKDTQNRDIVLTGPYAYTSLIPKHLSNPSIIEQLGQPFAGPQYGAVRSLKNPFPIPSGKDVKDELTRQRLVYAEVVEKDGPVCIMSDKTSQYALSELSYIEHVLILLKCKKVTEKVLLKHYFKNIDPTEDDPEKGLIEMQSELNTILKAEIGHQVDDFKVVFSQTSEQNARKIAACDIDIAFKAHVERFLVNVNIRRYL